MRARTIAYIIAALTPVWLLAFVAIQGRFFVSPYTDIEYGPEVTHRILAYRGPILLSSHYREEIASLNPEVLDKVTANWVKHHDLGELKSIEVLTTEDDGFSGFRAEIEGHRRSLIAALVRLQQKEIEANNWPEATRRATQIMQLCEVSKYNSPAATAFAARTQTAQIRLFQNHKQQFSESNIDSFLAAVQATDPSSVNIVTSFERIIRRNQSKETVRIDNLPSESEMTLIFNERGDSHGNIPIANGSTLIITQVYGVAFRLEKEFESTSAPLRTTLLGMN